MIVQNKEIRPYSCNDFASFTEMFGSYSRDDFKIELTDQQCTKVCTRIIDSAMAGISALDLLYVNHKAVGFIWFQIDSPSSDWNERESWGFIRELYIDASLRRSNLGKTLVEHAEAVLQAKAINSIYLTSDEAELFWIASGYYKTDQISTINHDPIYEKQLDACK